MTISFLSKNKDRAFTNEEIAKELGVQSGWPFDLILLSLVRNGILQTKLIEYKIYYAIPS